MPQTIEDALRDGYQVARAHPEVLSENLALSMLAESVGKEKTWLIAHREEPISDEAMRMYQSQLERVAKGEPLPYVQGKTDFFGLWLEVTPDVLIPRPETEELVQHVLAWAKTRQRELRVVDVGTGSGAIAVALGVKLSRAQLTLVDASEEALKVAALNMSNHANAWHVSYWLGDLLDGLDETFDIITANLPYVASDELQQLEVSKWEPITALDGGSDGLVLIRRLLVQAVEALAPDGLLALEIGYDQGESVVALCHEHFPDARVSLHQDFAGHDRVVLVETQEGDSIRVE